MHFNVEIIKKHPYVIGGLALAVFLLIYLKSRGSSSSASAAPGASAVPASVQEAQINAAGAVQVAQLNAQGQVNQLNAASAAQAQTEAYNLHYAGQELQGQLSLAQISAANGALQIAERGHEADLSAGVATAQIGAQQSVAISAQQTERDISQMTTQAQLDTAALNAQTAQTQIAASTTQTRIVANEQTSIAKTNAQTSIAQSSIAAHQNETIAQLLAQEQETISSNQTQLGMASVGARQSQSTWGGIASIAGSILSAIPFL